jgi:hypothetical protein
MKRALPLLLIVFFLNSHRADSQARGYYPKGGPDMGEEVSLIQLIANPDAYDGKRVRVLGYLHLEFEGDEIYLHREDFDYSIMKDAIWINMPTDITTVQRKAINDRYVICTAIFRSHRHGHMGMSSGEFDEVTRIEPWPRRPTGPFTPPPPQRKKVK